MAGSIATAYVQVMPSMEGVAPKVKSYFGGAGQSAGKSFGSSMGVAMKAGLAAGAAGLGLVLKESIGAGAGLQQSLGGIETLFKENAEGVKEAAEQAYRTAGMSANKYMETVTGFSASLIQSLEGDTQKAAQVADMALIDMSDNANKMGTDMQAIQDAYQGFAKQNYTMLDNLKLGYGGTKTEMQRLLADAQKLTGLEYDIDNLADVYSAIHAIQTELGITGTTAQEASTTLTGSFNSMKAAFQDVLGNLALGRPMEDSLEALAETTTTFLMDNLIPSAANVLGSLPGAVSTLWGKLMPGSFSDLASEAISSFTSFVTDNADDVLDSGRELLGKTIEGILEKLPELAGAAGEIVGKLGMYLIENSDEMLAEAKELGEKAAQAIWDSLVALWEGISASGLLVTLKINHRQEAIAEWVDENYGGTSHGGVGGSFAKGLDYVPYDGFIAELHEGEMVLTRAQANAVRSGYVGGGVTVVQHIHSEAKTAADLMQEARYEQEKAVLGLV